MQKKKLFGESNHLPKAWPLAGDRYNKVPQINCLRGIKIHQLYI